ncbi:unnamed protein product [Pleuronectes platessa]|uniref:Uncharacterized protein n=1 Tax=Pleuronectes platessa TaxID=8262 RepID=A0A9N7UVS9_PLEPL|nr:unnamed protein product [Pleuronectes platessa]
MKHQQEQLNQLTLTVTYLQAPRSQGEEALRLIFMDKMLDRDFTLISESSICPFPVPTAQLINMGRKEAHSFSRRFVVLLPPLCPRGNRLCRRCQEPPLTVPSHSSHQLKPTELQSHTSVLFYE